MAFLSRLTEELALPLMDAQSRFACFVSDPKNKTTAAKANRVTVSISREAWEGMGSPQQVIVTIDPIAQGRRV